jgi:hypothetical protein
MKTRTSIRTIAIAAALAASPARAAEDAPAPIRIGMLDTAVRHLPNRERDARIVSKDFTSGTPAEWIGESDNSHGELVAASAVKAARAAAPGIPITIYASNIYTRSDADDARLGGGRVGRGLADPGKIHLRLDYQAAAQAIDRMRDQGVTVMVLTATGADTPSMRALADRIKSSGMTLVASTNNDPVRGRVYPAAYPDVVAVAGSDRSLPIAQSPELAAYVSYVADGKAPIRGAKAEIGSSFAAGAIGGLAAAYRSMNPQATTTETRSWLDSMSVKTSYAGTMVPSVDLASLRQPVARTMIASMGKGVAGPERALEMASMDRSAGR